MAERKSYGLLISSGKGNETKKPAAPPTKRAGHLRDFFNEDDDEDVSETLLREAAKNRVLEMQKKEEEKAKAEENIYDYDGVYDSIKKAKEETLAKKEETVVKSKWINTLKKNAELKKKEFERSLNRIAIREQEKEDHLYEGKEKFVTSAYKQKLIEEKKWQEEQAKIAAEEERDDVRKKSDLTDLYRHMYHSMENRSTESNPQNVQAKKESTKEVSTTTNESESSRLAKEQELAQKIIQEKKERESQELKRKAEESNTTKANDSEKKETEDGGLVKPAKVSAELPVEAQRVDKVQKTLDQESINAARERYLARKNARQQSTSS